MKLTIAFEMSTIENNKYKIMIDFLNQNKLIKKILLVTK